MSEDLKKRALEYHAKGQPGKIAIQTTKPCETQHDLSLAYTPGVAAPVREIADNPDHAYSYTAKGNLVAVITDGTAVLGLGNVGALAGKPVMEGKAVLMYLILKSMRQAVKSLSILLLILHRPLVALTWKILLHRNVSKLKKH